MKKEVLVYKSLSLDVCLDRSHNQNNWSESANFTFKLMCRHLLQSTLPNFIMGKIDSIYLNLIRENLG